MKRLTMTRLTVLTMTAGLSLAVLTSCDTSRRTDQGGTTGRESEQQGATQDQTQQQQPGSMQDQQSQMQQPGATASPGVQGGSMSGSSSNTDSSGSSQ